VIGSMLVFGKPTAATEIPWRWAIAARFSKKAPMRKPNLDRGIRLMFGGCGATVGAPQCVTIAFTMSDRGLRKLAMS
jgi:hypothetical protein